MGQSFYTYDTALENPEDVDELLLSFERIPNLNIFPDGRVKNFKNLVRLVIADFKETEISLPNELSELENLNDISIIGDNLIKIPSVVWKLENLIELYLQTSCLDQDEVKLNSLTKLISFCYRCNKTKNLSSVFFKNFNLLSLKIISDDLEAISNKIGQLVNLTRLYLWCNLYSIPVEIKNLEKLEYLDIASNKLKELNIDFSNFINLKEVRWGFSTFFPTSLTSCPNLEILTLDVNSYFDIEVESLPFKSLIRLDISHSNLKEIPKCFSTITTLKTLLLTYNKFEIIDFDFSSMLDLKLLSFRSCEKFENIDMTIFIKSLKTIPSLTILETPKLSMEQKKLLKKEKFDFQWRTTN